MSKNKSIMDKNVLRKKKVTSGLDSPDPGVSDGIEDLLDVIDTLSSNMDVMYLLLANSGIASQENMEVAIIQYQHRGRLIEERIDELIAEQPGADESTVFQISLDEIKDIEAVAYEIALVEQKKNNKKTKKQKKNKE